MSELLTKLATALHLSEAELTKLIRSAPRRYRVYDVPKRKPGEFRTIAQPAKEVKALQYWVVENFLNRLPVHPTATAYRRGKSIIHNARPHRFGDFLLKLDFKDFFPSIKARDLDRYLRVRHVPLGAGDPGLLSRILFWKPKGAKELRLSIGAPSSPLLSNVLMYDFDEQVSRFCAPRSINYTRYADDLSFSADLSVKLREVEDFVIGLCRRTASPKLALNPDKLVRVSKSSSRRITGLTIANDAKVSLGRDRKRKIRAAVHAFSLGRIERDDALRLKGTLAFVKSVEPSFLSRLRRKYGADVIRRIQTAV